MFPGKTNILRVIKYGIIWCLSITKIVGNLNIYENKLLDAIEDDQTENSDQINEFLFEFPFGYTNYDDDDESDNDSSDNQDIDESDYVNICLRAEQIDELNDL